jgi:hypothetical protein
MVHSFTLTPTPYVPPPTPPKTYLQRCEEDLNPELASSFDKAAAQLKMKETATLVAFTTLVIGGIIATSLYTPVFIPVTGFSALFLVEPVNRVCHSFKTQAKQASGRADQLRAVSRHYQTLAQSTPLELQQILERKGIYIIPGMQRNDPRLTSLKPLIARHMFWEEHAESLQKRATEKLDEAAKTDKKNSAEDREEIFTLRSEALEWEREALESKCKNAFINAVIHHSNFTGTFTDMGALSPLSGQERAIEAVQGVRNANHFFNFKNSAIPPILYSEAKHCPVFVLGSRMSAAMATA